MSKILIKAYGRKDISKLVPKKVMTSGSKQRPHMTTVYVDPNEKSKTFDFSKMNSYKKAESLGFKDTSGDIQKRHGTLKMQNYYAIITVHKNGYIRITDLTRRNSFSNEPYTRFFKSKKELSSLSDYNKNLNFALKKVSAMTEKQSSKETYYKEVESFDWKDFFSEKDYTKLKSSVNEILSALPKGSYELEKPFESGYSSLIKDLKEWYPFQRSRELNTMHEEGSLDHPGESYTLALIIKRKVDQEILDKLKFKAKTKYLTFGLEDIGSQTKEIYLYPRRDKIKKKLINQAKSKNELDTI